VSFFQTANNQAVYQNQKFKQFHQNKCQYFFYPIKIGACINLNKPNACHFLGDKRSMEIL